MKNNPPPLKLRRTKKNKKIKIDEDKCIGCGLCVAIAPETFEMDPNTGKSKVKKQLGDDDKNIKYAEESCPVDAILIEEGED